MDPDSLKAILLDEDRGANELLSAAVAWLNRHSSELKAEHLDSVIHILQTLRPSMAGFYQLGNRLQEAGREGRELPGEILELGRQIEASTAAIAKNLYLRIKNQAPVSMVTLSWSSTVINAVRHCAELISSMVVLESHPGGEGEKTARVCGGFIKDVNLVPDERLDDEVAKVDLGVIGADTIYADGSVLNKVLSRAMARGLQGMDKPCFALSSVWKRSPRLPGDEFMGSDNDRLVFEVVPAELITEVLSEHSRLDVIE